MRAKKWAAVIIVVAFISLFVPFVPQTFASGTIFGAHYQRTAVVSPTYYAFHCGSYVDAQVSTQLASGFSGFYDLSKGYTFSCNYNSG
jgi:hypothetical protein